jgi:hypothetical protein
MNTITLTASLTACLLLTACSNEQSTPAPAPSEPATTAAAAASQTEAVYGDEAPVAIEAEPAAADDHAHNADGSHPPGVEHADDHAEEDADHAHGEDGDHTH